MAPFQVLVFLLQLLLLLLLILLLRLVETDEVKMLVDCISET